jgi:hypothetical protein
MAAKVKVDQIETVDGTGNITLNNSITMASNKTLPAASLTGTLPAIDGSNLTGVGGVGISDSADATAITIDSSEQVTISNSNSADNTLTIEALNDNGNEANVKLAGDISGAGMGSGEVAGSIQYFNNTDHIASISGMRDGGDEGQLSFKTRDTSDSAPTERFRITADGRGLSQFTAKAWVYFNGNDTVAINDSHNVSTITDNGTGDYNVNFTNDMSNASYCVVTGNRWDDKKTGNGARATDTFRLVTVLNNNTLSDSSDTDAVVFGD